jgi:hypothetical protein
MFYIDREQMCEGCGLERKHYGLVSEGKKRWCAGCGKAEGAVLMTQQKLCEGCGLKRPHHGLASEGKMRWCAGCGKAKGAVSFQKNKMCEGCGLKQSHYGLASEGKRWWCAGCGEVEGAVNITRAFCKQQTLHVTATQFARRPHPKRRPRPAATPPRRTAEILEARHKAVLRVELREAGLSTAGSATELVARLAEHGNDRSEPVSVKVEDGEGRALHHPVGVIGPGSTCRNLDSRCLLRSDVCFCSRAHIRFMTTSSKTIT